LPCAGQRGDQGFTKLFGGVFVKTMTRALLTAVAALLLAACGGGTSATASNSQAAVTGVATPTSVSAVTAN